MRERERNGYFFKVPRGLINIVCEVRYFAESAINFTEWLLLSSPFLFSSSPFLWVYYKFWTGRFYGAEANYVNRPTIVLSNLITDFSMNLSMLRDGIFIYLFIHLFIIIVIIFSKEKSYCSIWGRSDVIACGYFYDVVTKHSK